MIPTLYLSISLLNTLIHTNKHKLDPSPKHTLTHAPIPTTLHLNLRHMTQTPSTDGMQATDSDVHYC